MSSEAWMALIAIVVSVVGGGIGAVWKISIDFEKKIEKLLAKHDEITKDISEDRSKLDDQQRQLDQHDKDVTALNINSAKLQKDIDTLFYQFNEQKALLQDIKKTVDTTKTDVEVIKSKMDK